MRKAKLALAGVCQLVDSQRIIDLPASLLDIRGAEIALVRDDRVIEFMEPGIPALQLPLRERTDAEQERARTLCLLYDALMEWSPQSTWDIWRAYDSFGMDKVKWIPFWRYDGLVGCGDSEIRISAYLDKGRGALFVVANMGTEEAKVELEVKRRGLGLKSGGGLMARDEAEGTDLEMSGDKVALTVKPGTFRLVSVQMR